MTPVAAVQISAHDDDLHAWATEQAAALRARSANALDWDNLAEEIEDMAGRDRRELMSRLRVIAEHLLKLSVGANREPAAGWTVTIRRERREVAAILEQSPSLRRGLDTLTERIFAEAREDAAEAFRVHEPSRAEDYAAALEQVGPYAAEQLLDPDFLPAPPDAA